jgi:predicted DNA binding protein
MNDIFIYDLCFYYVMWVAKVKLVHKECITSQRTKKFNVTNLVYGLGTYEDKNYIYFNIIHFPRGTETNVRKFIDDVKKDKRMVKFEESEGMFFTLIREPKKNQHLSDFFNPKIFYLKPDINTPTGHEIFEVASWDRKELEKFIDMTKKKMKGELLKLKEERVVDLFFPHVSAKLTNKQRMALSLANKLGYYDYPRKIDQIQLAKIMKTSKSTFQYHLRMAEKKIMPFLMGNYQTFNK